MTKVKGLKLFRSIQQGEFSNLPKPIYSLLVLAANNLDQKTLVVHSIERPTVIERVAKSYPLKGIKTELETDIDQVESLFNKTYKITINVRALLSSIQSLNQIAKDKAGELQVPDGETAPYRSAKQKQIKEKERIIYKHKIEEVKPIPYKKKSI